MDQIRPYITTDLFLLTLVLGAFYLGIVIYQKTKISFLQPLLIAMIIIIPFLKITGIEYRTFIHTRAYLTLCSDPVWWR